MIKNHVAGGFRKIVIRIKKRFLIIFFMVLLCILGYFIYGITVRTFIYPTKYSDIVCNACETYGVDKDLVFAIIKCESGFDEKAHSRANAKGLMQITPETFRWLVSRYTHEKNLTESDLEDPKINISYGCLLLSILKKKYKSEDAVLSAYNAGMTTTNKWLSNEKYSSNGLDFDFIPYKETRDYVERVKKAKNYYKNLY